ncbi:CaiB/BaiF CoA transferase family protein [Rhodoligotrophos ferricapiens]|uniref:CaiB/BaiF CoA transferase family protein n=1 Tax=Rhodoligotrophos ferricapiens TaxID=3069264 RepID=UPI00315D3A2F
MDSQAQGRQRPLPLAGIKVLDLSRVLSGPLCTMTLADLGAEVWKIENISGGDDTRAWSVPSYNGTSTYYLCANRGKQSIAVDLKSREGQEIVQRLAAKADILVENFRTGVADKLGVGFDALSAINPRLIYCSISGYGQTGPDAHRPGYDFIVQAESGLMSVTGEADGAPTRTGTAIVDITASMVATQAITAALYERERTGAGQHIDLAMFDCAMNLLINIGAAYLNAGVVPRRHGNGHPSVVPYEIFEAADGDFALAVGNDKQFAALCRKVINRPDLAEDIRFMRAGDRATHRSTLVPLLRDILKTRARAEWITACRAAEVPAGMVHSLPEAFDSPNVRERNLVQTVDHPELGPVRLVRPAHGLAAQREASPVPPPMLGQDTAHILGTILGYDQATIEHLREIGAIGIYTAAQSHGS